MTPRVFIGTPTHACKAYCAKEFVAAVRKYAPEADFRVMCNSKEDPPDYAVSGVYYDHIAHLLDSKCYDALGAVHERIIRTCNILREFFLDSEADLYLSLESDVLLGPDTLPRMLSQVSDEYPVVYANCYRWPNGQGFLEQKFAGPVDRVTMGCTLIKRHVLEKIEFRYDPNLLGAFPDAHFAYDCRKYGFGMWYDPTNWVDHVESPATKGTGTTRRGWNDLPKSEQWWRNK